MAGAVHLGPPAEEREQGNSLTPSWLQDFFPPGLRNLLQLSEADAGPYDSPLCEVPHDAPKHKPHPQTSPGAVPALEGALGSPVPTLQAEPTFPGWVLGVSRRSVPRLGSPKAQRFLPSVTPDLEMPVHWESQLFLGCYSLARESETSLCAHEGCDRGSCLPQNVLGGRDVTEAVGMHRPDTS